ncbi:hypothetical protein Hanom_Chr12g01072741 [Helianthus anomalus]
MFDSSHFIKKPNQTERTFAGARFVYKPNRSERSVFSIELNRTSKLRAFFDRASNDRRTPSNF